MSVKRRAWTGEEIARLGALLATRAQLRDVAAALGRTESSVQTQMSRNGLRLQTPHSDRPVGRAKPIAEGAKWVRCLGIGSLEEEHSFFSESPSHVRICGVCRRRTHADGISWGV